MNVVNTTVFPKLNSEEYPSPCLLCDKTEKKVYVCATCTLAKYCSPDCALNHKLKHNKNCRKWQTKLQEHYDYSGRPLDYKIMIFCTFDEQGNINAIPYEVYTNLMIQQRLATIINNTIIATQTASQEAAKDSQLESDWVDLNGLNDALNS